ncbi:hypothetical protein FPQ18DRAFT_390370 [Pyronema domesticum]|nr:hypothetical protein FPQ18DRAFT_390370 [Pyronema domesticum]
MSMGPPGGSGDSNFEEEWQQNINGLFEWVITRDQHLRQALRDASGQLETENIRELVGTNNRLLQVVQEHLRLQQTHQNAREQSARNQQHALRWQHGLGVTTRAVDVDQRMTEPNLGRQPLYPDGSSPPQASSNASLSPAQNGPVQFIGINYHQTIMAQSARLLETLGQQARSRPSSHLTQPYGEISGGRDHDAARPFQRPRFSDQSTPTELGNRSRSAVQHDPDQSSPAANQQAQYRQTQLTGVVNLQIINPSSDSWPLRPMAGGYPTGATNRAQSAYQDLRSESILTPNTLTTPCSASCKCQNKGQRKGQDGVDPECPCFDEANSCGVCYCRNGLTEAGSSMSDRQRKILYDMWKESSKMR